MTGPRTRRAPALRLGVVTIFVVAIAAALASGATRDRAAATPSIPTGSLVGSLGAAVTATPIDTTATTAGASSAAPLGSGATAIDPMLLAVLPVAVGGAALTEDPDTEAHDATDPSNAADLAAVAVAIVVDSDTGDLAVASVVRPRPGVFSDAYFGDWRATFDAGACSQAGGVTGTGTATIARHETFTATCSGGLTTFHVHLADRGLIVSVSSLGQGQFGRLIVEGLR